MAQIIPKRLAHFNLRTVTLGISLVDCISPDWTELKNMIVGSATSPGKLGPIVKAFSDAVDDVMRQVNLGPIKTKRVTISPLEMIARSAVERCLSRSPPMSNTAIKNKIIDLASEIEDCVWNSITLQPGMGVFLGGYTALIEKGTSRTNRIFLEAIPDVLQNTKHKILNVSVNVATSDRGIDLEAVRLMGEIIERMGSQDALTLRVEDPNYAIGDDKKKMEEILDKHPNARFYSIDSTCARLAVFANAPYDNPFMAGGYHGPPEPEVAIHVGISGAGDIQDTLEALRARGENEVMRYHSEIREIVTDMVSRAEGTRNAVINYMNNYLATIPRAESIQPKHGIVDLSIAPTDLRRHGEPEDSIAKAIEAIGAVCGCPGTLGALALIVDAIKKAGASKANYIGGLSGTFIPLSEDAGMADAVASGNLNYEKYEGMTSVCSVGVDMIPVYIPQSLTPTERATLISGLIIDEMAIGVINDKVTSVRILPILLDQEPDKDTWFIFKGGGGLLGASPALVVPHLKEQLPENLIALQGRIAQPVTRLTG